tara:strand:+ start:36528 stop:37259 length:732 start_codon:yes stop_codon:yes gene_type:complete
MIKAVFFDLDGTLIHTELLKARSYAQAMVQLTQDSVSAEQVVEAFKNFIGRSRNEVVSGLATIFRDILTTHLPNMTMEEIREKVLETRLSHYHKMIDDPSFLTPYFCQYNLALLSALHNDGYTIVVATMSNLAEVEKVIAALDIADKITLVLTREDVEQGKPDPEIYLQAKQRLQLQAAECLVVEDSLTGVKAALAANMKVFAVTNELTKNDVVSSKILDPSFIINDLTQLQPTVYSFVERTS